MKKILRKTMRGRGREFISSLRSEILKKKKEEVRVDGFAIDD